MTEDELAELAELRRRAYGPDADIAADPAARSRLAALEAAARAEHPGPALAVPVPTGAPRRRVETVDAPGGTSAHDPAAPVPPVPPVRSGTAAAETAGPPSREVRARRRWTQAVGAVVTVAVVVVLAAVLWPRASPARTTSPSPSPSPSIATAASEVTCGSGWGPKAAGTLTPPHKSDVVWSAQWNAASPDAPTTLLTNRGQWLGLLTTVFVPGGVASVVQVIGPSSARIVSFSQSETDGASFTTSEYADTDAMVAAARRIVPLPPCADPDTYPLLVIAPAQTCVQLEVTLAEGQVYRAGVAIGSRPCPRT